MSLSQAEIESIVRRVLSTLTEIDAPRNDIPAPESPKHEADVLSLSDRLVTLESLKNRLHGKQTLSIPERAVITPAAIDLCKQAKVKIVRALHSAVADKENLDLGNLQTSSQDSIPRLVVAGSGGVLAAVARQLCPKQATVLRGEDDTSAMRSIATGIRSGHKAAIAIVATPHASCWQAARDELLRPAVVSHWNDLAPILSEVPVNLLILGANQWNVPAICNLARRFHQHILKQI